MTRTRRTFTADKLIAMHSFTAAALTALLLTSAACATRRDAAQGVASASAATATTAVPAAPPAGMTQAEMDAYAAAAAPGEMHAWLAKGTGSWKGVSRNWSAPNTEPMSSEATMSSRMELGGRFLMNDVRTEWPEIGTFEGRATLGYDVAQRMFVSSWVDNMGTGMMTGTGQLSDDRKTLTLTHTYFDPAKKRNVTLREVIVRESDDRMWVRIWSPGNEPGTDFLMMETTYLRQSASARPRVLNDGRGDRD